MSLTTTAVADPLTAGSFVIFLRAHAISILSCPFCPPDPPPPSHHIIFYADNESGGVGGFHQSPTPYNIKRTLRLLQRGKRRGNP